jgi:hypothetical protein
MSAIASENTYDVIVIGAGQIPVARLWHAVPCFPTISEVWLRLLEAYRDDATREPRSTARVFRTVA